MSSSNRQVRQPFSRGISAAGVKKKSKAPKYPPALDRRLDLRLVKFYVLKPWITDRVTELLGVAPRTVRSNSCTSWCGSGRNSRRIVL